MKRFFLFLIAFFAHPKLLLAAEQLKIPDVLSPPAIQNGTDMSIDYLKNIFGVVDGVLYGSGSQIVGQMFGVFNAGALVLGVAIISYIVLIGVLKTATEGETLGKEWNSIWIPARAVMGIALLIPSASGYSVIQIFMMWVIVQGVAVADSVWNVAVDYIAKGGVIVQSSLTQQLSGAEGIPAQAKNMLKMQTCLNGMQTALNKAQQQIRQGGQSAPEVPILESTVFPISERYCTGTDCRVKVPNFPTGSPKRFEGLNGLCGSIQWTKQTVTGEATELAKELEATQQIAIQSMLQDLQTSASRLVSTQLDFAGASYCGDPPKLCTKLEEVLHQNVLVNTASVYQNIMYPILAKQVEQGQQQINIKRDQWMKDARAEGWITAGGFFRNLSAANIARQVTFKPPTVEFNDVELDKKIPDGLFNAMPEVKNIGVWGLKLANFLTDKDFNSILNVLARQRPGEGERRGIPSTDPNTRSSYYCNCETKLCLTITFKPNQQGRWMPVDRKITSLEDDPGQKFFCQRWAVERSMHEQLSFRFQDPQGNRAAFADALEPVLLGPMRIIQNFMALRDARSGNINPMLALPKIGAGMLETAGLLWLAGGGMMIIASIAAAGWFGGASVITNIMLWLLPVFGAILTFMFAEGAMLAFYIPLIPMIIFLFAAIGWLLTVVEAMAAAPLIALGITHPEGHAVLGKADPAVLVLVSVFIRPSLMIIGLIVGIIISYVGLWMLNDVFWKNFMLTMEFWTQNAPLVLPAAAIAVIFIYILLVISLLNMAFAIIENLHANVMGWLSGKIPGGGEAREALGTTKEGFAKGVSAVSSGKGTETGLQQAKERAAKAEAQKEKEDAASKAKLQT